VSAFIDERREDFGVEPICSTLGVSASAYYRRATGERSARALEDRRLLEVIKVVHKKNYEAYGYRRMWKALLRGGERVARCQVQRLMATHGIQGAKRRGKPWRTTKPDLSAARPGGRGTRNAGARRLGSRQHCAMAQFSGLPRSILRSIAALSGETYQDVDGDELKAELMRHGLDPTSSTLNNAMRALKDAGYLDCTFSGGGIALIRLEHAGRQEVEGWPTSPGSLSASDFEELLTVLQTRGEDIDVPEADRRKRVLRRKRSEISASA